MLLSLAKLSQFGFNQRPLSMDDFYKICEREEISVLHEDIDSSFYMVFAGKKFIVLAKKLNWLQESYIAFHELAHAMCDPDIQSEACFFGVQDSPREREADAFAAIALIPRDKVDDTSFMDNCCCGIATKIYETRINLYERYGV